VSNTDRDIYLRIAKLEAQVAELFRRLDGGEEATGFGDEEFGFGTSDPEVDPRVIEAIQANKDIEAIKLYRAATGTDLAVAKEAVDNLKAKYGING
jgi:ribosomal protein L7/L12